MFYQYPKKTLPNQAPAAMSVKMPRNSRMQIESQRAGVLNKELSREVINLVRWKCKGCGVEMAFFQLLTPVGDPYGAGHERACH